MLILSNLEECVPLPPITQGTCNITLKEVIAVYLTIAFLHYSKQTFRFQNIPE